MAASLSMQPSSLTSQPWTSLRCASSSPTVELPSVAVASDSFRRVFILSRWTPLLFPGHRRTSVDPICAMQQRRSTAAASTSPLHRALGVLDVMPQRRPSLCHARQVGPHAVTLRSVSASSLKPMVRPRCPAFLMFNKMTKLINCVIIVYVV
jgi:anti-sigma factor ChrR (cupin superfamily)